MKSKPIFCLLIILGAAMAQAQEFQYAEVDLKGLCPKISYITNFNMDRIVGWYYIPFTTLNSPLCLNNEGRTIYAAQFNENTINLQMCCRSEAKPEFAVCGSKIGTGTATVESTPGQIDIIYEFDNNAYPVFILDTDYENYSIVYGCKTGAGRRSRRDELIIVFSRNYQLNENLEKRVRNVLEKNGADWSKVKLSKQGPLTPYTPGPRPCSRDRPWDRKCL